MLVARFPDELAGGDSLSVAGAMIGDMFARTGLGLQMKIHSTSLFVGPPTGPVVADSINCYASMVC